MLPAVGVDPATGRGLPKARGPATAAATWGAPHSPQNFVPGLRTVAQLEQIGASELPHSSQNFVPEGLSVPQLLQTIHYSSGHCSPGGQCSSGGQLVVQDKRYLPAGG